MSYQVATGTWAPREALYNAEQEMTYDYVEGELFATQKNITESDVNIIVHEKKFLVVWNRARILVSYLFKSLSLSVVLSLLPNSYWLMKLHKIWSPSSNPAPEYVLDFEANVAASWLKLATSMSSFLHQFF